MGPPWVRLTVAVVFLLVSSAPFYVEAATMGTDTGDGDEGPVVAALLGLIWLGLSLLTGAVVGWPALALPFVVVAVLTPLGTHPTDSDGWSWAQLYAVPAGFFSFFALLAGWLGRVGVLRWRRRGEPEVPADGAGESPARLLWVPLAVAAAGVAALGAVSASAGSTEVMAANVSLYDAERFPPKPAESRLELKAGGPEGCNSEDNRTVDVRVRESAREVVVSASVEVHADFNCASELVRAPFDVVLQRPLGDRRVIGDNAPGRVVLWPTRIPD